MGLECAFLRYEEIFKDYRKSLTVLLHLGSPLSTFIVFPRKTWRRCMHCFLSFALQPLILHIPPVQAHDARDGRSSPSATLAERCPRPLPSSREPAPRTLSPAILPLSCIIRKGLPEGFALNAGRSAAQPPVRPRRRAPTPRGMGEHVATVQHREEDCQVCTYSLEDQG